jgi:hypothetical protein
MLTTLSAWKDWRSRPVLRASTLSQRPGLTASACRPAEGSEGSCASERRAALTADAGFSVEGVEGLNAISPKGIAAALFVARA